MQNRQGISIKKLFNSLPRGVSPPEGSLFYIKTICGGLVGTIYPISNDLLIHLTKKKRSLPVSSMKLLTTKVPANNVI